MNKEQNNLPTLFFIKDLRDGSVWAINEISTRESNRLGWLNGVCVSIDQGDDKNYIGADCGIDAEYVFTNKNYEVSKNNIFK